MNIRMFPLLQLHKDYINRPTMSGIVDRLSKKEWLTAKTNPDDRRSQILNFTDKSRNLMNELDKVADALSESAVEGFTESEVSQLKTYLSRIITNLL